MSHLSNPIFHDDAKARKWLEARIWANGVMCPHCGSVDNSTSLEGKAHRPGVYQCNEKECRKQFTVTVGTVFERSKIPLSKWLMATFLLSASKKGMSTRQLSRMLGVSVKSSWFMTHRIREAMRPDYKGPLGGEGKIVEADETYLGGKEKNKHKSKRTSAIGGQGKMVVFSLIERDGNVRSHNVPDVSGKTLRPIITAQVHRKSVLMTDEAGQYRQVGREYARHEKVNHGIEEYVRGDAYTNTVEGYFSILKRGITGVYHHVSQKHLHRYLAEFDFRYSSRKTTDFERASLALMGIQGKRLTYRRADAG